MSSHNEKITTNAESYNRSGYMEIDNVTQTINDGHILFPEPTITKMEQLGLYSLDSMLREFKETFNQSIPYIEVPKIDGLCYKWSDDFIYAVLIAMATDRLDQMSSDELVAWRYFVNFQNYHTHSAREEDANSTAIGCTVPDTYNHSFVVAGDGTVTDQLCQPPSYEVEGEQIWKSLDNALIRLYNCEEIDQCSKNDMPIDIHPCTLNP